MADIMKLNNTDKIQNISKLTYHGSELLISSEKSLKNYNQWVVRKFLSSCTLNSNFKILDFGAGVGSLAKIFYKFSGVRPCCLEIDPEQRKIISSYGFLTFSSLEKIQKKFDIIYTSNVLEHIENDAQMLINLRLKLKPKGKILIYLPAFNFLWTSLDDNVGHYRRYDKRSLGLKLLNAGYKIEKMSYCDSVGFFLSLIFKYLPSSKKKSANPSQFSLFLFDLFLLPISKIVDLITFGFFGKNIYAVAYLDS
jgi:SAM-dependent methyltransferase